MNLVERLKKDKKGFTLVEMIVVIVMIEAKYPVITGFFNQSVGIMQK